MVKGVLGAPDGGMSFANASMRQPEQSCMSSEDVTMQQGRTSKGDREETTTPVASQDYTWARALEDFDLEEFDRSAKDPYATSWPHKNKQML